MINLMHSLLFVFCVTRCQVIAQKLIEKEEDSTPDVICSEKVSKVDEVVMRTKSYSRNGKEVMIIQTRDIPKKSKTTTLYLTYDNVRASFLLRDEKLGGDIIVEPGPYLVSFKDSDENGVWDFVCVRDEGGKILEAYRRTNKDLLAPVSGIELKKLKGS